MILVTIGTERFSFNRLMKWIDGLIQQNLLHPDQEEIIIQYGSCNIIPRGTNNFSVLPSEEFNNIVEKITFNYCSLWRRNSRFVI